MDLHRFLVSFDVIEAELYKIIKCFSLYYINHVSLTCKRNENTGLKSKVHMFLEMHGTRKFKSSAQKNLKNPFYGYK